VSLPGYNQGKEVLVLEFLESIVGFWVCCGGGIHILTKNRRNRL